MDTVKIMIQPVIASVPGNAQRVERLVRYCRELDGTKVRIIPVSDEGFELQYPGNAKECRAAHSLRTVALAMQREPFLWLETDSIPLRKGFVKTLSDEYLRQGNRFLLSSDENPPYDYIGGIGIYSGDTACLVPEHYEKNGWDLFLIHSLPHLVARTPLIQHSYGIYTPKSLTLHQFPRDQKMIRDEAVIFHKDQYQGLMNTNSRAFVHSGDLGDIIAALPAIREIGGGKLICTATNPSRESLKGKRYEALRPLVEAQPYITAIEWQDAPQNFTHSFDGFRIRQNWNNGLPHKSLLQMQAEEIDPRASSKVVIARSYRYQNPLFPWDQIADYLGDRAIFTGLPEEHKTFQNVCRHTIAYVPTSNLLELAGLIAGAKLFIGNQSCPFWIAAGLGVPLVQEVYCREMNSIVIDENAYYPMNPQGVMPAVVRFI